MTTSVNIFLPLIFKQGPTDPTQPEPPEPEPPPDPTPGEVSLMEAALADLMLSSPLQEHPELRFNLILAQVAQARANDMAERAYFGHVNPEGEGANYLVRQAGFRLPTWYGQAKSSNNIESIGAGFATAADCWQALGIISQAHSAHLCGKGDFYRDQNRFGLGYCRREGSPYTHYWVVLIAKEEPP